MRPAGVRLVLALSASACTDPYLPLESASGGSGGASGGSTSMSSGSSANPSTASMTEGTGGAGGEPPLAIDLLGPAMPRAFERASLPIAVRVRGPIGSQVSLRVGGTTLAETLSTMVEEDVVLQLPLERGASTVVVALSDQGSEEVQTPPFEVYGGRPVAAALDRMLAIDQGVLLEWGAGDPGVRSWTLGASATSVHARDGLAAIVHEDGSVSVLDLGARTSGIVSDGDDIIAAALGAGHLLLLKRDGELLAIGNNASGQLGAGHADPVQGLVVVEGLEAIVQIAAADETSYAVDATGAAFAWGANDDGQLGLGDVDDAPHATPTSIPLLADVLAIAAGRDHAIAIHADGTLSSWGIGSSGQLGNGASGILADRSQPVEVSTTTPMVDVFAASNTSYAIGIDGRVWAWGHNSLAQLGVGDTNGKTTPTENGMLYAAAMGAGATGAVALDDAGGVFVWGSNASAQLGLPPPPRGPARSADPVEVVLP